MFLIDQKRIRKTRPALLFSSQLRSRSSRIKRMKGVGWVLIRVSSFFNNIYTKTIHRRRLQRRENSIKVWKPGAAAEKNSVLFFSLFQTFRLWVFKLAFNLIMPAVNYYLGSGWEHACWAKLLRLWVWFQLEAGLSFSSFYSSVVHP